MSSPAAILRAWSADTWPLASSPPSSGRGERVAAPLDALTGGEDVDEAALAPETPAGRIELPVACVDLAAGVEAAAAVDPSWLAEVDRRRGKARNDVVAAGREKELEAALHVAMLVGTGPVDGDVGLGSHRVPGYGCWPAQWPLRCAASRIPSMHGPGWSWPAGGRSGRAAVGWC